MILAPENKQDYYSKLFNGVSQALIFQASISSSSFSLPLDLANHALQPSGQTIVGSQNDITYIVHLDDFGQDLNALAHFEPKDAASSLWTVFDNIRTILYSMVNESRSYRLIVIHHGHGDFGRRSPVDNSFKDSRLSLTYISALSGMLKSVVSEYQSMRSTVIDINHDVFESDDTLIFLDFICSLEEPEHEYTINQSGLHVHTIIPYQSTSDFSLSSDHYSYPKCLLALGGARGIAVSALEKIGSKQSSLVITGRSNLSLPKWYDSSFTVPQLRSHLIQLHRDSDEKFTPVSIERELKKILSSLEAITTIERLSKLYSSVTYIQVDFLDPNSHNVVLEALSDKDIQVDAIINVAGIIEDSLVARKNRESFERVLLTKLNALKLTFQLIESHPVARLLNFASIAGKTGNLGQSDYASANELINAGSWLSAHSRPGLKVNSINWGPWASAGMATKEVNEAFSAKGIIPIPLDVGAECIASLLTTDCSLPLEVTTGLYDSSKFTRSDYDIESISKNYPYLGSHTLSLSTTNKDDYNSQVYKFWLDPNSLPYLKSHRKFGRPVMPAAASCVFALEAYQRVNNSGSLQLSDSIIQASTEVLSGIVFDNSEPRELLFEVAKGIDSPLVCNLKHFNSKRYSYRTQVQEISRPEISSGLLSALSSGLPDQNGSIVIDQAECYDKYLFHDGVFTVINGPSMILPNSEIILSTLESHGTSKLLGIAQSVEGFLDPSLLDGLLQMGLVILRELYQTSALPNRLVVDIYEAPVAGRKYIASGRIIEVNSLTSKAYYEGIITSEDGSPLLCLSHAEMTHSTSMID